MDKQTPAEEVVDRFLNAEQKPPEGTVEIWATKCGRPVFVLPVFNQDETSGENTVMKLLWFDDHDHDWVLSNLEDRLDHRLGQINLKDILNNQGASHGKCERHD